ncbi:MAG: hypothetical protein ACYTFK_07710 [Planctomycetota bacterium]|jgi:hypothetical protein
MTNTKATETLKVMFLAVGLVALSLYFQCNIGVNLADEGFLWYGAVQTSSGQIPIRDFQSYDPGRYYWTAFWLKLLGNSLISLRISCGIFQVIGMTLGLLVLRRAIRSWWMLAVAGFVLLAWMIPRHKLFDSSIAMSGVFFAFYLIQKPSLRRHFISGIFVGIAAFFGRNHGLYNFLAFMLVIPLVWLKLDRNQIIKRLSVWIVGVLVGYSPMLIMMLAIEGFWGSFVEEILVLLDRGSTNISRPVPWPWKFHISDITQATPEFLVGSLYLFISLFYFFSAISISVSKREYMQHKLNLIAATLVGMMYMHHAFSRAGVKHLAQSIGPFLIAFFALPFTFNFHKRKVLNAIGLLVLLCITYIVTAPVTPYHRKRTASSANFVKYDVAGDLLWVRPYTARLIETVSRINSQIVPKDEGLLLAPHWPGFYPILQRESPLKEIYFLFPKAPEKQKEMINQLKKKNVNWVILHDKTPDGRQERRFCNTHRLLWEHFINHFEPVQFQGLPTNCQLLHRKSEDK